MEQYTRILIVTLSGCLAALMLQKGSFRMLVSVCCICICAMLAAELLRPLFAMIRKLGDLTGINPAVFSPLIKAVFIAVSSQLGAAYCSDAGEKAIASVLEFGGMICVLYVSLPLFEALIDLISRLMGE